MLILMIPRRKVVEEEPEPELEPAYAGPQFVVPDKHRTGLPDLEFAVNDELKEQIDKFAEAKPEAVAQLLRNWLTDEWD